MALGDIHNHNGSICKATKRPCPFGEEGHSKDTEAFVAYHEKISGVNGEKVRELLAEGVSPADAVYVARMSSKGALSPKKRGENSQVSDSAMAAQARFETYKRNWLKTPSNPNPRITSYGSDSSLADGVAIAPQPDGALVIPAGEYVFLPVDELRYSYEPTAAEHWLSGAKYQTPPGAVGGAYLHGKPSFFFAATDMGKNHGHDGEMLMPMKSYEILRSEELIIEEPQRRVTVSEDATVYGYLGNPADAPMGLYEPELPDDEADPAAWDDEPLPVTLFNHPAIAIED